MALSAFCAHQQFLRVNNKGWDIQIFQNPHKLEGSICKSCKSVCYEPAELGCKHDTNDIFLYCKPCLDALIAANDGKCPISSHEFPLVVPSGSSRRQILNSRVVCPYSVECTHKQQHDGINDYIVDTPGSDQMKEGVVQTAPCHPPDDEQTCQWEGTLRDLLDHHLASCAKQTEPNFKLHETINALQIENEALKQMVKSLQNQLSAKDELIQSLQRKNEMLSGSSPTETKQDETDNDQGDRDEDEKSNSWIFNIPIDYAHKFVIADPFGVATKIKYTGSIFEGYYKWITFGPVLRKGDKVMAKLSMKKVGARANYAFGFATSAMHQFGHNNPAHAVYVSADFSFCSMKDEFSALNEDGIISKKTLSNSKFGLIRDAESEVIYTVDMKKRKGSIGDHRGFIHFVLPDNVQILLGLGGTEHKIVKATVKKLTARTYK